MIVYVHTTTRLGGRMAVLDLPATGSTTAGDIMDAALPQLNVNVDGDYRLVVGGTPQPREFAFSPHELQRLVLTGAGDES